MLVVLMLRLVGYAAGNALFASLGDPSIDVGSTEAAGNSDPGNAAYAGLSIDVGSTGAARNAAAENDLKCRSGSK